jgi:uroporphyrinogen III methyltransferase/synthase
MTDKYIVITRPLEDEQEFSKKIQKLGLKVFSYPTIKILTIQLSKENQRIIDQENFDWVIFTSKNGILFFIETLKKMRIYDFFKRSKKMAVVGPETAKIAKKYGLKVDFIPSKFTTENLAMELPNPKNLNILLPRADIASDTLTKLLIKRGANVTNIPIYKTELITKPNSEFLNLLIKEDIGLLIFTSPSTIDGFLESLPWQLKPQIKTIPLLVIGPVTAKFAKREGFKTIVVADEFTTDGIVKELSKIV